MAVQYTIPPWIRAARPAEHYAKGYGLGLQAAQAAAHMAMQQASLNHAAQRLAQENAQAQARLQIAQNEFERRMMHDQQMLEVTKEYHNQQNDLAQARIKDTALRTDLLAKQAAYDLAGIEGFKRDIANNMDPAQAAFKNLTGGHRTSSVLGAAMRAAMTPKPTAPGPMQSFPIENLPGYRAVQTPRGMRAIKDPSYMTTREALNLGLRIPEASVMPGADTNTLNKAYGKVMQKTREGLGIAEEPKRDLNALIPLPKDKKEWVDQQAYITAKGPGIYHAKSGDFEAIPAPPEITNQPTIREYNPDESLPPEEQEDMSQDDEETE